MFAGLLNQAFCTTSQSARTLNKGEKGRRMGVGGWLGTPPIKLALASEEYVIVSMEESLGTLPIKLALACFIQLSLIL